MKFVLVKNNKAPAKSVFEYLNYDELQNPNPVQVQLLKTICDSTLFLEANHSGELSDKMEAGDYLYSVDYNGTLHLEILKK